MKNSNFGGLQGIYKIFNCVTGEFYIGSSGNIGERINTHVKQLRAHKHPNIHLQNSWNKYKENTFEFEVILLVEDRCSILSVEQKFIEELRPSYNIRFSTIPTDKELKKYLAKKKPGGYSKEMKEKMSIQMKAVWKRNREYMLERMNDPDRIEKIRKSSISMWKNEKTRNLILKKLNEPKALQHQSLTHKLWWEKSGEEFLKRTATPEIRKKRSDSAKKMWQRTEYKENKKRSTISNYKNDIKRRKITDISVILEIRHLYDSREISQSKIAEKFGISRSGVQSIGLRKTWAWLDEQENKNDYRV